MLSVRYNTSYYPLDIGHDRLDIEDKFDDAGK